MRVILHRVADDIGDFRKAPVVGLLHSVKYASLHRLQAVVDVGHATVKYNVRCIVNPIVLEHRVERNRLAILFHVAAVAVVGSGHSRLGRMQLLRIKRLLVKILRYIV